MNGRHRFRSVLAGGEGIAFAPLAWARLPEFVLARAAGDFWRDAAGTQRMLGDAVGVCGADAVVVPLLPGLGTAATPGALGCGADEIAGLPEVIAAITLSRRLAAAADVGLVVELPAHGQLAGLLAGAVAADIEDALSELVRLGLEAGADAVAVRHGPGGSPPDHPAGSRPDHLAGGCGVDADVARTVDAISSLADFYGAAVLGIGCGRAWTASGRVAVSLLGPDGSWPALSRGLVLTSGDITRWWTPGAMRTTLSGRGDRA